MRRILLIACASLALAGCETMGGLASPAPLASTALDDQVVAFGFESLDTVRALVDKRIDEGRLVPGSAPALTVASHLRTAADAMRAFSAAQRAGSTTDATAALAEATRALALIKTLLR